MNLWIRTQDKRLAQIVDISQPLFDKWENKEGYCLYGYNPAQIYVLLGMYETKERALEVLNEIQSLLGYKRVVFNNVIACCNTYENINSTVYEMPKE